FQTLIARWNGTSWAQQTSPNPGDGNFLNGAAAISTSNVWAVGHYVSDAGDLSLVEHWNGTSWAQQPSPSPGSDENVFNGVAATSASSAWAVGRYLTGGTVFQTLIARWNGTAWKQVPSPNHGGATEDNDLFGVAATSASSAWAVGEYYTGT